MIVQAISDLIETTKILSLQTYFPKSYSLLEDSNYIHKDLFGKKIRLNQTENNYYSSHIENLKIQVFEVSDSIPNAFTVPGISSLNILKQNPYKYQTIGLKVLSQNPLTATVNHKNNNIIFNSDINDFRILVFINSGLFKRVPNIDDRFAIILHEIGHWVYINNLISSIMFKKLLTWSEIALFGNLLVNQSLKSETTQILTLVTFIIRIALLSITNIKSRQSEYDADRFVKEVGRGSNLQNALSLLAYKKEFKDIQIDQNIFISVLTKLYDFFSIFLFTHTHPPIMNRLRELNESIDDSSLWSLSDILNPLDNLISLNQGLLCKF